MTRGMRLLIVFCVFIGVIVLMMDCAKKTMRKKQTQGIEGESREMLSPDAGAPAGSPGGSPDPVPYGAEPASAPIDSVGG